MNPYFEDNLVKIYNGDARNMSKLLDNSVQCVVTSPPYWGLRKYSGLPDLIWGNKDCEHRWGNIIPNPMCKSGKHSSKSIVAEGTKIAEHEIRINSNQGSFCSLCGAWKGQLGLEPTPELYLDHLVEICREIKRVMRKDGVFFLNCGDSYMSHGGDRSKIGGFQANPNQDRLEAENSMSMKKKTNDILKDKDLCLIPFRLAIALQSDGWWVRSIIIWSKPNPMPESVTDRPTESHEYILLLTKSARYYWDAEAVREPYTEPLNRWGGPEFRDSSHNIRSVWEFPTQPYPEAHFAVFPEKLPEICIKAASKVGDLILDPFVGSGTTLWVAKKLGRRAVGYELSEEYCQLALERNRQMAMEV